MAIPGIIGQALDPFRGPTHLTLADRDALARAPRTSPEAPRPRGGTRVTVEGYAVPESAWTADHMFARYDDGRDQFIYRGGGSPKPWLHARVDSAQQSPDAGTSDRILFETELPGTSARQAIAAAEADAKRINGAHIRYDPLGPNSNTLIGDFTERQFGRRIGDDRTPGYTYPKAPPEPIDPIPRGMYRPTNPIW